jgi:hypothetical protein
MTDDKWGGLSEWAVKALGFDEMCKCGHENGHHLLPEMACSVLECICAQFTPTSTEGENEK